MSSISLQDRLASAKNIPRLGIHSFHRFFGKLIPAIPAAAVELYTEPGDLVFDPFCGSGTTLVEAIIRNRNTIGADINPLAVLISRVKTTPHDIECLRIATKRAKQHARVILHNGLPDPPYCVNIHHWYRPSVIRELSALSRAAGEEEDPAARDFLIACLSAINRNVSNADPRHVFPGYSKRLRQLDRERGRRIDVFASFDKGVRKRLGYLEELAERWSGKAGAHVSRCSAESPPGLKAKADLIVTNPPYISSVRYLETLKLEMSWVGYIDNPERYRQLDREQIGTEKFSAVETRSFLPSGNKQADDISRRLFDAGHARMSRTLSLYFKRMAKALLAWDRMLRAGGRMVIKISPSRVRGELVPTQQILAETMKRHGYSVEELFQDFYNPNSRSLLTPRNYYSGRMDSDWILVLRKK